MIPRAYLEVGRLKHILNDDDLQAPLCRTRVIALGPRQRLLRRRPRHLKRTQPHIPRGEIQHQCRVRTNEN